MIFNALLTTFYCSKISIYLFFKIIFKKILHEYNQIVNHFWPKSGPTFCRAWVGSKLFTNVMSEDKSSHQQRMISNVYQNGKERDVSN